MQLTFGDAEGLGKRKQTRREIFLAEMERIVPWKRLLALIEPHYPVSGRPGRQPYALATMLRIHLLQQWYALSDPAMEEALHEIPTLRRFAQLGGLDNVPDETTILNFRRLLKPTPLPLGCWKRSTPICRARAEPAVGHDRRCDADRCAQFDQECRSCARP
ncbi:transposase [Xanthomonas oryzae]|nr:transposase [Xanthomonas oryzae]